MLNGWIQVRKFVVRREVKPKNPEKKTYTKAPKIQRLVTPQRLQHKRHRAALKRRRAEAAKDAAVRILSPNYLSHNLLILPNRLTTLSSLLLALLRRRASVKTSRRGEQAP